ncbi:MAG: hypothetical protein ACPGJV_01690 [Bacteriovoracaceae bacterium]
MSNLLFIERYVLECIRFETLSLNEIHRRTGLNREVLKNVLINLKGFEVILYQEGRYRINLDNPERWRKKLHSNEALRKETEDLFSQLAKEYFKDKDADKIVDLSVQKAELDEFEMKILSSHLKTLKDFFNNLKYSKKPKKNVKKHVFLWASSDYEKLVKASLSF